MIVYAEDSGLTKNIQDGLPTIQRNGKKCIPYCDMKEKACYESSYWGTCPNFEIYIIDRRRIPR